MSVKTRWSDTRPNGKPVEPGTLCLIYEVEGQNEQAIYGKDHDEIIAKMARTLGTAQAMAVTQRAGTPPVAAPAPAAPRRMTPDDVVRRTQDLTDPARSADAMVALLSDSTGIDLRQMAVNSFERMGTAWEEANPDFYPHPGNKSNLVMRFALPDNNLSTAELAKVTPQMLDAAFVKLKASGYYFPDPQQLDPESSTHTNPDSTLPFPGGSQVQRAERPRGTLFATGARPSALRAPQAAQPKPLIYTEKQIRAMSPARQQELIDSNDPDYAKACDVYFAQPATA